MLLLIDNYDSFVHNLARYFQRLGQRTEVIRNDAIDAATIRRLSPDAIVLSPGPCTPNESGGSLDIVRGLAGEFPILGVCLGHQIIAAAFGGRIVRAVEPMHGRASPVRHGGENLFNRIPSPFAACRYHSLVLERSSLPNELNITAWTDDGTVMAIAHREQPIYGVQFHPEAILTEHGFAMLANFLRLAGQSPVAHLPEPQSERPDTRSELPLPAGPVTF